VDVTGVPDDPHFPPSPLHHLVMKRKKKNFKFFISSSCSISSLFLLFKNKITSHCNNVTTDRVIRADGWMDAGSGMRESLDGRQVQHGHQSGGQHATLQTSKIQF
jgi:methionine salvage enolase-phosphatase E1